MTHLDIPDEVVQRAVAAAKMSSTIRDAAGDGWGVFAVLPDIVRVAIHSAGPLLVAAELERLATELIPVHEDDADDEQQAYDDGMTQAAVELRACARELRGEAKP